MSCQTPSTNAINIILPFKLRFFNQAVYVKARNVFKIIYSLERGQGKKTI